MVEYIKSDEVWESSTVFCPQTITHLVYVVEENGWRGRGSSRQPQEVTCLGHALCEIQKGARTDKSKVGFVGGTRRKSYLVAGFDSGGEHAGAIYSLIGSAKLSDLESEAYLPRPARAHSRSSGQSGLTSSTVRSSDCPRIVYRK